MILNLLHTVASKGHRYFIDGKRVSLTGLDYGILKAKEFGRTVYNVIGLPKPENSYGHELLAERVRKGD